MDEILVIYKEEHHHWPTCPCDVCRTKREEQIDEEVNSTSRLRHFTPHQAHVLGFIPSRSPGGSLARATQAVYDSENP